jgi:hypothetical protein
MPGMDERDRTLIMTRIKMLPRARARRVLSSVGPSGLLR